MILALAHLFSKCSNDQKMKKMQKYFISFSEKKMKYCFKTIRFIKAQISNECMVSFSSSLYYFKQRVLNSQQIHTYVHRMHVYDVLMNADCAKKSVKLNGQIFCLHPQVNHISCLCTLLLCIAPLIT